jgi:5-methylcytosine-specific restriction protein B
VSETDVRDLLRTRRFVVLQGPPGTGKTRMATIVLRELYAGRGRSIQFHPNTTYENFIGGLAPASSAGDLGLRFSPIPGALMEIAAQALDDPSHDYLLHIDEINRADLGKILGEALFLLEPSEERQIQLPFDFGPPFHRTFFLPKNLHILGTMNNSDRSIAILDLAVRRRFAFVSLWPQMGVVKKLGCEYAQEAFQRLIDLFIEYASEDALLLTPGHSYFLHDQKAEAIKSFQSNLVPLLEEYLAQGYVGGFSEAVRAELQWLRSPA